MAFGLRELAAPELVPWMAVSAVHRAALNDSDFSETVVKPVFLGRYARVLSNRFITEQDADAPFGHPEVHYLAGPLRAASVRARAPRAVNVQAGKGFRRAEAASAANIGKRSTV